MQWSLDNNDQYPFRVSTNAGGTKEFCALATDGFDSNSALHFIVMSNELNTALGFAVSQRPVQQARHQFCESSTRERQLPSSHRAGSQLYKPPGDPRGLRIPWQLWPM